MREGNGAHPLGREHPVKRRLDAKPDRAAIGHHELGAVDWKFCHSLPDVAFGFLRVVNHLASPNEALPPSVFVGHPRLKTRLVAIFRKPLELRVREGQHIRLQLARFPVQANNPIVLDFEILVGVDSDQVREARCGLRLAVERSKAARQVEVRGQPGVVNRLRIEACEFRLAHGGEFGIVCGEGRLLVHLCQNFDKLGLRRSAFAPRIVDQCKTLLRPLQQPGIAVEDELSIAQQRLKLFDAFGRHGVRIENSLLGRLVEVLSELRLESALALQEWSQFLLKSVECGEGAVDALPRLVHRLWFLRLLARWEERCLHLRLHLLQKGTDLGWRTVARRAQFFESTVPDVKHILKTDERRFLGCHVEALFRCRQNGGLEGYGGGRVGKSRSHIRPLLVDLRHLRHTRRHQVFDRALPTVQLWVDPPRRRRRRLFHRSIFVHVEIHPRDRFRCAAKSAKPLLFGIHRGVVVLRRSCRRSGVGSYRLGDGTLVGICA